MAIFWLMCADATHTLWPCVRMHRPPLSPWIIIINIIPFGYFCPLATFAPFRVHISLLLPKSMCNKPKCGMFLSILLPRSGPAQGIILTLCPYAPMTLSSSGSVQGRECKCNWQSQGHDTQARRTPEHVVCQKLQCPELGGDRGRGEAALAGRIYLSRKGQPISNYLGRAPYVLYGVKYISPVSLEASTSTNPSLSRRPVIKIF